MSHDNEYRNPNIPQNPGDTVLAAIHARTVDSIHQRHEEARVLAGDYVHQAPAAIASYEDACVVMLTLDGVRPYRDERKPYYLLYESPRAHGEAWFDFVDEHGVVERREVSAFYRGQGLIDELEQDLYALLDESVASAPSVDQSQAEGKTPEVVPLTEYEELRLHEERIHRWSPTSFSDAQSSAA
jgi:hypothetical protein